MRAARVFTYFSNIPQTALVAALDTYDFLGLNMKKKIEFWIFVCPHVTIPKVLFFYTHICLTFVPSSSAHNSDVYLYIAISI
jgi:hypothetical protein